MDVAKVAGYKPPPEFQEDARDPLVELNLTDSTELWLIQWPVNQVRLLVHRICQKLFMKGDVIHVNLIDCAYLYLITFSLICHGVN